MFFLGLEVQFTTNLRITPGWYMSCSPGAPEDDSFWSRSDRKDKHCSWKCYTVYIIPLVTFCIWTCASVFGLCYLNTVKVNNFVRAKKWIWWGNSSIWWRIGLEDLKCPFNSLCEMWHFFLPKAIEWELGKSVCNTIVFCLLILAFLDLQFDRVINNCLNPKEIYKKIIALLI